MSNIFENSINEKYKHLLHYTSVSSFEKIMDDMTFKCNNLANMNDKFEMKRLGIEGFSNTRFVTCFCHAQYEIVPFWFMYGDECAKNNILLCFQGFPNDLEDIIESDYAYDENKEKLLYCQDDSKEKSKDSIYKIKLFDVEYLDYGDESFNKSYGTYRTKMPSPEELISGNEINIKISFDAKNYGMQKTIGWEYEKETRLMCTFSLLSKVDYKYIFIRLKEKIFENMIIYVNPWAESDLVYRVQDILNKSPLSKQIRDTITIKNSVLYKTISEHTITFEK